MNKLVAVLSIVGSLIAIATFMFDVKGRPISKHGRGVRGIAAALLALLGVGSWFAVPPPPASQSAMTTTTESPATTAQSAETTIIVEAPSEPAEIKPEPPTPRPAPKARERASAITSRGVMDDEVTMQVRDAVGGRPFTGTVEQSCMKDDALEGMITCELTLRVRVGDETAVSLDTRGGGFTERAAERQARERLAKKIAEWGGNR